MTVPDLVASALPAWSPVGTVVDGLVSEVLEFDRWRAIVTSGGGWAFATVHESDRGRHTVVAAYARKATDEAKAAVEKEIIRRWVGPAPAWREGADGECSVQIGPVRVIVGPTGQGAWLAEVVDSTEASLQSGTFSSREVAQWMGLDMASARFLRWAAHLEMLLEADAPPLEARS